MDYLFFDTFNEERYRTIDDRIVQWDVSNVTSMEGTFKENENGVINLLGHWDVSNVTNMSHLFEGSELGSSFFFGGPIFTS